jgi:hypothetical protein
VRYLYQVEDDEAFAYERSRRDFYLVSDDTLWAHESHAWLLAAAPTATIAHRIGRTYYDAVSGEPLYYERDEPAPQSAPASLPSKGATDKVRP